jgi:transglutaminase-like putative cysteine protease
VNGPADHAAVGATSGRIRASTRLAGITPGTGAFIGAWFVAGAIGRLTGAPVILAIMAALVVLAAVDLLTGWLRLRTVAAVAASGPEVTTAGERTVMTLAVTGEVTASRRDWSAAVAVPGGAVVAAGLLPVGQRRRGPEPTDAPQPPTGDGPWTLPAEFDRAGVVDRVIVTVEASGPIGLSRWRRCDEIRIAPIHVAPVGDGALLDVAPTPTAFDGLAPSTQGVPSGDTDGVRAWRDGDPVGAVHWPSSMRAGDLIVHDRLQSSDEAWVVDLDAGRPSPSRLRRTLDEGRHRGHVVVVVHGGCHHVVRTGDDAARWAAIVAEAADPADRTRAHRRVGITASEPQTGVESPARWTAAAAAVSAAGMLVGALGWSIGIIGLTGLGLAIGSAVSIAVARRWPTRPAAVQALIAAAVLLALVGIVVSNRDVAGLLAVLRGPMPDLLLLLVVLHGFEVTDRRTLRVHLAITAVVAAYASGLRIDGALGWWLTAWGTAFVASLLLTTRVQAHPASATGAARPRSRRALAPVAWTVGAVAATLALLAVVPVPDGPARLGLPALDDGGVPVGARGALVGADGAPQAPSTRRAGSTGSIGGVVGYPGFSDTLDTSVRGDLGDEIVMRVRAPEPAFWRGQTFTDFDGRVWTASEGAARPLGGMSVEVPPTLGDPAGGTVATEELVQTFHVEQDLPNLLFAASRPTEVIVEAGVSQRPDGALLADVTLGAGSVYTVVSDRVQVSAADLRAQGDLGELFADFRQATGGAELDPFLDVPASTTRRTLELAAALRGPTTYDTIRAYEAWLGANTEYDLDAPVPDGDAVDDFLFGSRRGYCEQIASALTVMLRSQGVPARLATGYVAGERDRVSGVWNVRASDAHAWVEVWFPVTGWQPFDPTASVPLAADASAGTVGGDLAGALVRTVSGNAGALALVALAASGTWLGVRLLREHRRRRRRGRWGVLQDRFEALDAAARRNLRSVGTTTDDDGRAVRGVATNRDRAATIGSLAGDPVTAEDVGRTLDRAAFDPAWTDDDATYERTRSALRALERTGP